MSLRIIGVWASSIAGAADFVNDNALGSELVQFIPDSQMRGAHWIMLRVDDERERKLRAGGLLATPRWTFL